MQIDQNHDSFKNLFTLNKENSIDSVDNMP